ncbi:MAG TPA: cofactor-independent phosphoglycerate mutase [Pseudobacteroides sp.]|uniref:cofactor-independent phosphoglycerate mutase n=1 Tax=Pseudobacteroides sp. TaxID=1968840 RepID=UPI002F929D33
MKYIVVLGDGMADYRIPQLENLSPLEKANKPNIDKLAQNSRVGMVKTVPGGIPPGSDAANLSVMGYNPKIYYSGRSPLEAVSMGIELNDTDVTFRCNLVTLSDDADYSQKTMIDYSSDEISTKEAHQLISEIQRHFGTSDITFFGGISYRHCMVWKKGSIEFTLTPPHDILDKKITDYMPKGPYSEMVQKMMIESYNILKDHPVNIERIAKGLRPANSIWIWGEGKKPALASFKDKYKITGSVISAVDLIKGIGICAGLDSIDVEGATGNIHTNFLGKAEAALKELDSGKDFVYVHIEAPDECGHRHEVENKVRSIELIDELVVGTLLKGLEKYPDYRIMVLPDHPTPLSLRTHTSEPVPFLIYQKGDNIVSGINGYDEFQAKQSGIMVNDGYTLMDSFIQLKNLNELK